MYSIHKIECINSNAEFVETYDDDFFKREKIWKIVGNDVSIQEIWLHELRQLNRIRGYPSAEDYLVLMRKARKEPDSYVIEYDSDQNTYILSEYLKNFVNVEVWRERNRKPRHPLYKDSLKNNKNRIVFWDKIIELMSGLEILHKYGILHRNINLQSVIVEQGDLDFNFKLTGFERSLNLMTMPISGNIDLAENIHPFFSYNTDWMSFGLLICTLLNGDYETISYSLGSDVINNLEKKEIAFINELLSIQSDGELYIPLESHELKRKVRDIIYDLDFKNQSIRDSYTLCVNLKQIATSQFFSENNPYYDFSIIDQEGILDFIRNDLSSKEKKIFKHEKSVVLAGRNLFYVLRELKHHKTGNCTWNNAYCDKVIDELPDYLNRNDGQCNIFSVNIEVISRERIKWSDVIDTENSWESIFRRFKSNTNRLLPLDASDFLGGMVLNYALEVANHQANLFPVNIFFENKEADPCTIRLSLASQAEQIQVETALRLGAAKTRLDRFLFTDKIEKWVLILPEGQEIQLVHHKDKDDEISDGYIFETTEPAWYESFDKKHAILTTSASKMTEKSLKRKSKALEQLSNNANLIKSLIDPTKNTQSYQYDHRPVLDFEEMDDPKQKVFREILQNHPNYVVQGPPGVGKTFLITTILQQIFKDEPYSKIVLSAQSHSTINVLFRELRDFPKAGKLPNDLIIIDNFKKEDDDELKKDAIINEKNNYYKSRFNESKMFKEAKSKHGLIFSQSNLEADFNGKKFYESILASANIILATTNSWTIEELYKNNIQFDVVFIEEAGKASGTDLISPLLLSHKRVLIGDPNQLPPFLSSQIDQVSESLDHKNLINLRNLVSSGDFRTSSAREAGLLDRDFLSADGALDRTLQSIRRSFYLFDRLVNKSSRYNVNRVCEDSPVFGGVLTEQYRMNPDLSLLISSVFYKGCLSDNKKKKDFYTNRINKDFYFSGENFSKLNSDKGVAWVDILDPNKNHETKAYEKNYKNKIEANILKDLLVNLYRNDKFASKKSIVILSPYKKQVDLINQIIGQDLIDTLIERGFKIEGGIIAKTVDSFQGGEADIVFISMVRHNTFTPIGKSLGFLVDERRMNVMLSRAKHQLVVVGCFGLLEFWTVNNNGYTDKKLNIDTEFLVNLVKSLKDGIVNAEEQLIKVCDFLNLPLTSIKEYES